MYLDFFHFQEIPFSIAPDPRYLYLSDRHREALAHLLYGIRSEGGFVLLTGEVGTGKTTVCRCLLEQTPANTEVAFVLNPKVNALELLATICDELRIDYDENRLSVKSYVDLINKHLLQNHAEGRKTVLIIDEAQNLTSEVLEQIRLLTNLETRERKLLQVIMLGQPELRDKLAKSELRQLSQRITARYHLEPLSREETSDYIRHRLAVAGSHKNLFSPSALSGIYQLSGGIPRRINVLCDRSLLGAYVRGREKVTPRIVKQAGKEVFDPTDTQGVVRWWALAALAVFGIGLTFLPQYLRQVHYSESLPPAIVSAVAGEVPSLSESASPWDTLYSREGAEEQAFKELFLLWGYEVPELHSETFCQMAGEVGLGCLSEKGGLDQLRRLDRPAVLKLQKYSDSDFYGVLTSLDEEVATFQVGDAAIRVPVSELGQHWSGDFTLLWRRPPFEGLLHPGDGGEAVRWLDLHIALALGQRPVLPEEPILQGTLLQRLKEFQLNHGLTPDGIAGPLTLIQINSIVGNGIPHLSPKQEAG